MSIKTALALINRVWGEIETVNQRGSTTRDQRPMTTHNNG
jgi:hypothetical protein